MFPGHFAEPPTPPDAEDGPHFAFDSTLPLAADVGV